ncbi:hypothetical protein Strvi_0010 (plasmid) [Streptomyces violaceusniger Tu 4113]|uniref:Uncharacterized protein n=1 Tax=Streptomyces violaceusniger (strain Tu 4113) TaxID=653045 RepID=G2PHE1_STRV4|nr:hypothetical protein Strvi_0010 [Streptomyces violaceusniger Tu 4113]
MSGDASRSVSCQCGAEGVRNANGWVHVPQADFCPTCWQDQQRIMAENRERSAPPRSEDTDHE